MRTLTALIFCLGAITTLRGQSVHWYSDPTMASIHLPTITTIVEMPNGDLYSFDGLVKWVQVPSYTPNLGAISIPTTANESLSTQPHSTEDRPQALAPVISTAEQEEMFKRAQLLLRREGKIHSIYGCLCETCGKRPKNKPW